MRSRQEIKAYAKQAFAAQRGSSILAILLVMLLPFAIGFISGIISSTTMAQSFNPSRGFDMASLSNAMAIGTVMWVVSVLSGLLIMVLTVNLDGAFVKVFYGQQITATEPYSALKFNFGRKLGGMLWMMLWMYLWSLVGIVSLFIPTIIKGLAYSMTPYILASNPNVTATNALKISMRMTKGHKGKIFVMYLSFIGWQLLNVLTFGILGLVYVNPYMYTSLAGLFIELRNQAVVSGAIHPYELDGPQQPYGQAPQQSPYAQPPQHPSQSPYAQPPQQYPYGSQPQAPQSPYAAPVPPAPQYAQPPVPPPASPYAQPPAPPPPPQQPPASPYAQPPAPPPPPQQPPASPYAQPPAPPPPPPPPDQPPPPPDQQ